MGRAAEIPQDISIHVTFIIIQKYIYVCVIRYTVDSGQLVTSPPFVICKKYIHYSSKVGEECNQNKSRLLQTHCPSWYCCPCRRQRTEFAFDSERTPGEGYRRWNDFRPDINKIPKFTNWHRQETKTNTKIIKFQKHLLRKFKSQQSLNLNTLKLRQRPGVTRIGFFTDRTWEGFDRCWHLWICCCYSSCNVK